jgi:hypothetical protein
MKILTLILGATAAAGIAGAVSANPVPDRIQLAQAQDSAPQSGSGLGASPRNSTGNRESGAAATRGSEGSGATARESAGGRTTVRNGTQTTSRTVVRERSGGTRVSVHGRSRAAVGVRTVASDDAVVIRRKKARRYIYSEPTTTVIRKKRYVSYSHPSTAVIVKKRRAGIAVDSGVSTRTTVRSRTSVGAANPSRANPSASVRERSSGQGTVGAGGRTGGESGGRSGASDGGAGASTTGRQ